jgi:hypothetical protein
MLVIIIKEHVLHNVVEHINMKQIKVHNNVYKIVVQYQDIIYKMILHNQHNV